jgi:nitric oxide reductase subunit B
VTGSAFIHAATWARLVPDLVFDVGVVALLAFVLRAWILDAAIRKAERAGPAVVEARRAA